MIKPLILVVDDDPLARETAARDLSRTFSHDYEVRAESSERARETLDERRDRDEPVALLLVDERLDGMTGVEFLQRAADVLGKAKRVLFGRYHDAEAAIDAMNRVRIDGFVVVPWDPPEQMLYPLLRDLLDDWRANHRPRAEQIRLIGRRWSPQSHRVKDFLARNQLPYVWLDVDQDERARRLAERVAGEHPRLPLLVFPDSSYLQDPSNEEIADKAGLHTHPQMRFYDLVIVGAGPAGLAAAVYGASEGIRTVLVEHVAPGGQAGTSSRIENYLGFPEGISGADLARRAVEQARRLGAEILVPERAERASVQGPYRSVLLSGGETIGCYALLIATGVSYRRLDVPGMERLIGKGVYYGASTTEGPACRDEDVYLIGGGNSAGQAAIYFSTYARRVVIWIRGDSLATSMSQYLIEQIEATPNISVQTHRRVVAAEGHEHLRRVTVEDTETGRRETVRTSSLFIFIGAVPHTRWLGDLVQRDANGYILAGRDLLRDGAPPRDWPLERAPFRFETSVPGIFVAGDVRYGSPKRVAAAVGEGAAAVQVVHEYLDTVR